LLNEKNILKPGILFEDDSIIVLDKPSGWIVNSALTTKDQPVIQSWLKKNYSYEISQNDELRSGVVHRLDKETSGILVIAKTEGSFVFLQKAFKEREIRKTYIALTHGRVESNGSVEVTVGRLPWRRDRFGIVPGGRDSKTDYKLINIYRKDFDLFSLVECYPKTGRTHQIRIHFKHINHAIVGDTFYAGRKTSRNDRIWCPRLFLHASEIEFNHPLSGKKIKINSELPKDLSLVLKHLQKEK
jgi:23S rRNA pseudouridine1911/1915/1917 synthase